MASSSSLAVTLFMLGGLAPLSHQTSGSVAVAGRRAAPLQHETDVQPNALDTTRSYLERRPHLLVSWSPHNELICILHRQG